MSMNKGLNATTIVGGFFLSLAVLPAFTSAEVYIGGQVGVTFPQPLSGVERTSGSSVVFSAGTKITDLKLATSAMYGLGYYLDRLRWLGMEGEIQHESACQATNRNIDSATGLH
jgi:hypothetical protein